MTAISAQPPSLLMQAVQDLQDKVGHTPLHLVTRLFQKQGVKIYAKKEWMQLSGSVKARAAFNIFKSAIERGILDRSKTLLDATSGNTGIAYAAIGKALGIKVVLCLPENASKERKEILQQLGAGIIYTSPFEGTDGAQQVARELAAAHPDHYFYADQYRNPDNWKAHYYHTAPEILEAVPGITHFVAGLGTTGTFTGTGRRLLKEKPGIQLVSVQPDNPLHGLEGWKHLETALVPPIYDDALAHQTLTVSTEEAYAMIAAAAKQEELLLSPSAAANLVAAIKLAHTIGEGTIVTVLPDNADKYSEVIQKIPGL